MSDLMLAFNASGIFMAFGFFFTQIQKNELDVTIIYLYICMNICK